jgi:hypothetical protein
MPRCSALLLLSLLLGACPGNANLHNDRGRDGYIGPIPDWPKTKLDKGTTKKDGGGTQVDQKTGTADLALTTTVGGPCPCKGPLLCVLDKCRQPCQQAICNAATNCDPDQACINTSQNIPVCVPAVGTGQACTAEIFCAMGNRCLTKVQGSAQGTCYAACTNEGSTCNGGTCNAPDPNNKACLYCY